MLYENYNAESAICQYYKKHYSPIWITMLLSMLILGCFELLSILESYYGKREVWTDNEQAKAYFIEMMMSTEGEEHERAEGIYIQLLHGLDECSDEDE